MLKVFYKSDEELDADAYAWNGCPVCSSYVVTKKGEQIDTADLTEEQILSFLWQGIMQSADAKKQDLANHQEHDFFHYEGVKEVYNLLFAVKEKYTPSLEGMQTIIRLMDSEDQIVQDFARHVLTETANRGRYQTILFMADHMKRQRLGMEWPINQADILQAARQMAEKERAEKQTKTRGL